MFKPVSFAAVVAPKAGVLELCSAGPIRVLALTSEDTRVLEGPSSALGLQSDLKLASHHSPLLAGDIVLAYGTAMVDPDGDEALLAAFDQRLALSLEPQRNRPLAELATVASDLIAEARSSGEAEGVVLMFRRRRV